MTKKDTNRLHRMSRTEVINALAAYAHPTWYQSLIEWETPKLKALLAYYEFGGELPQDAFSRIHKTKGMGDEKPELDLSKCELWEVSLVPAKRGFFNILFT